MKKMVFLMLALLMASFVRSQFVVEKLWESTSDIPAVGNAKQGSGYDGTIYIQDKSISKIYAYTQVGSEVKRTEFATSDTGSGFDCDDAGNLIVRTGYFASAAPNGLKIYRKGETIGKNISFTLTHQGRTDYTNATGDIFSDNGGYVFFYCTGQTTVSYVKIRNGGEGDGAITVGNIGTGLSAGTSTSAVYSGNADDVTCQIRSSQWQKFENGTTSIVTPPDAKTTTLGATFFTIKDVYGDEKEIWAYNTGTVNYDSHFKVRNMTDESDLSTLLNAEEKTFKIGNGNATSTAYANWLCSSKIDEKTFYIHQFHPGNGIALYKVYDSSPSPTITIDGITDNHINFSDTEIGNKSETTITIAGTHLANDIIIESNNPVFEINKTSIQPTTGTVAATTLTITFNPTTASQENGIISVTSKGVKKEIHTSGLGVEPTQKSPFIVEKLWESTENLLPDTDARQGAGYNGVIYTVDKTNKKAYTYTHNGTSIEKAMFIDDPNLTGTGIAIDDAGNIVYGMGFPGSNPSSAIIVKAGEQQMKTIQFTLPKGTETNVGRTDYISAFGNMFSAEGGLIFFYSQNQVQINYVKVTNGGISESDITVGTISGNEIHKGNTGNNIFKGTELSAIAHARSSQLQQVNQGETAQIFHLPEIKTSTLGGCTFTIKDATGKDHEIWVYNTGTVNYDSQFKVYDKTDDTDLADNTPQEANIFMIGNGAGISKNSFSNWLTSSKINDGTYYIHQYSPGVGIALYKVYDPNYIPPTPPSITIEGISEKTIDFGTINTDEEKQFTFNLSGKDLLSDIVLSSSSNMFTIHPNRLTAIEGILAKSEITVTFAPSGKGEYTENITITSDGISEKIILKAKAVEPKMEAPIATEASNVSINGFTANWNQAKDAVIYQIIIGTPNEDKSDIGKAIEVATSTDLYYVKEGLQANTEYAYKIAAADSKGNVSEYSNVIIVKTEQIIHTIMASVSNEEQGTITPSGEVKVVHGENQSFSIAAHQGYKLDKVLVNGMDVTSELIEGIFTFANVLNNHTIEASFTSITGVDNINTNDFSIYYDAPSDRVILSQEALCIEITNMAGQYIAKYSAIHELSLSDIPSGIYLFKITLPEGIIIRKVMK